MIIININRNKNQPIFKQIFKQLKQLIENNTLKPGFRMPSTRTFAEKHGVNRSTVYKAYEELWTLGYIESRPGSYSIVRKRQQTTINSKKSKPQLIDWSKKSTDTSKILHQSYLNIKNHSIGNNDSINLVSLELDPRLYPIEKFRKCINTVLIEKGNKLLRYGNRAGYQPLRSTIARRLRIHGISINSDEILMTNGAQNGIELILKLLVDPGTPIVIESPTYSYILPLLKTYQADIIEVPMKMGGIDLDILQQILKSRKPAFIYTMPNFQNPTGLSTDQMHREKLLNLCESFQVPILEDAFEEEMKYYGKVPLPIKSMDRHQLVIYVGTFSKILFPGIRTGWIAGDKELIQRLLAIKTFSDLTSSSLLQASIHEFFQQGYFDQHIKRIHCQYRKRMHTALNALRQQLSCFKKVSWTEPSGGYLIWLKLEDTPYNEKKIINIFNEMGVILPPGTHFFSSSNNNIDWENPQKQNFPQHFRISIATLNEQEIIEGISRLGKAISKIYQ